MMQWTGATVSPNNTMEFCNGSSWTALATSGTVSAGTQYQMGYYATTGSTISGDSKITTDGFNVLSVLSTTITANDPVLNLSQTWNSGGTTFTALNLTVTNTASAAASLFMALKSSGTSEFTVDKSGDVTANGYENVINNNTGYEIAGLNAVSYPSSDSGTGATVAVGPGALSTQYSRGLFGLLQYRHGLLRHGRRPDDDGVNSKCGGRLRGGLYDLSQYEPMDCGRLQSGLP